MKKNMRKDINFEIEIPKEIKVELQKNVLILSKDSKEIRRKLNKLVDIKVEGNKIKLEVKNSTKKERKVFGTIKAHIKNMVRGLEEGFKYKLQIANVHFPMTVSHDKEKNELVIKNFLGEKTDRRIKLVKNTEIKINKDIIEIKSENIELAGQCAANIEKGSKPRRKDRRIFQDGIYIIEKPGRIFLK